MSCTERVSQWWRRELAAQLLRTFQSIASFSFASSFFLSSASALTGASASVGFASSPSFFASAESLYHLELLSCDRAKFIGAGEMCVRTTALGAYARELERRALEEVDSACLNISAVKYRLRKEVMRGGTGGRVACLQEDRLLVGTVGLGARAECYGH